MCYQAIPSELTRCFPARKAGKLFLREPAHQLSATVFYERVIDDFSHLFEAAVWCIECAILVTQRAPHLTFAPVGFCATAIASFSGLQRHSTALTLF